MPRIQDDPRYQKLGVPERAAVMTKVFHSRVNDRFNALRPEDRGRVLDSYLRDNVEGYAKAQDVGPIGALAGGFWKELGPGTLGAVQGLLPESLGGGVEVSKETLRNAEEKYPSPGFFGFLGGVMGSAAPIATSLAITAIPGGQVAGPITAGARIASLAKYAPHAAFSLSSAKMASEERREISEQREAGEEISGTKEALLTAAHGSLGYLSEYLGLKVLRGVKLPENEALQLGRAIQSKSPKAVAQAWKVIGKSAGIGAMTEGPEEAFEQVASNLLNLSIRPIDPDETIPGRIFEGVPQATAGGALGGLGIGPIAKGVQGLNLARATSPDVILTRKPRFDPFEVKENTEVRAVHPTTGQYARANIEKVLSDGNVLRIKFDDGAIAPVKTKDTSVGYIGMSDEQLGTVAEVGAELERDRRSGLRTLAETEGSNLNTLIGDFSSAFDDPTMPDQLKSLIPFYVDMMARNEGKSVEEIAGRIRVEKGGDVEPGALLQMQKKWYSSRMQNVLENMGRSGMIGEKIRSSTLKKQLLKRGVKLKEMEATGLEDLFKSQNTVSQEDLRVVLMENLVEVTEEVRGDPVKVAEIRARLNTALEDSVRDSTPEDERASTVKIQSLRGELGIAEAVYGDQGLPGGTDQIEISLVLPTLAEEYQDPHFGVPGAFAHIRMETRKDKDGNRVLFIKELQSDMQRSRRLWEQQEAKKTFARRGLEAAYHEVHDTRPVLEPPSQPFGNRWSEVAFKRALKWAADKGFDRVAWTDAKIQREVGGIGEEKAKILYDKQIPEFARKYGERFGAKVEDFEVKSSGRISSDLFNTPIRIFEDMLSAPAVNAEQRRVIQNILDKTRAFAKENEWEMEADVTDSTLDELAPFLEFDVNDIRLLGPLIGESEAAIGIYNVKSLPITPKMREHTPELFQQTEGIPRGSAAMLESGHVMIRALQKPDVNTAIEEMFHAYQLLFPNTFDDMAKWAGAEETSEGWDWTVNNNKPYEKLAKEWMKYLSTGRAPSHRARKLFNSIKEWMKATWNRVTSIVDEKPITTFEDRQLFQVHPRVRRFFDNLVEGKAKGVETGLRVRGEEVTPTQQIKTDMEDLGGEVKNPDTPGGFRLWLGRGAEVWGQVSPEVGKRLFEADVELSQRTGEQETVLRESFRGLSSDQLVLVGKLTDEMDLSQEEEARVTDKVLHAANTLKYNVLDLHVEQVQEVLKDSPDENKARILPDGSFVALKTSGRSLPQILNKKGQEYYHKLFYKQGLKNRTTRALAKNLVDRNIAKDENEALAMLREWSAGQLRSTMPYFQRARLLEVPDEFRELNPAKFMPTIIRNNNLFIAGIKQFGFRFKGGKPDQLNLAAEIEEIRSVHGSYVANMLDEYIQGIWGKGTSTNKIASFMSNYETITKLAGVLGSFRNRMQMIVNGVTMYGPVTVARAHMTHAAKWNKESKRIVEAIRGSGITRVGSALTATETPHSTMVQRVLKWAGGFSIAEKSNQEIAGIIALYGIEKDIKRLHALESKEVKDSWISPFFGVSQEAIKRRLDKIKVTDKDIIFLTEKLKRSQEDGSLDPSKRLDINDIKTFAFAFNRDHNFPMTITTEPLWWRNSPWLRLLAKFKPFGLEQVRMIYRDTLVEARHGNMMPMLRFVIAGEVVGELYNILRDILYGREESISVNLWKNPNKTTKERLAVSMLNNLADGGVVGIFADAVYGVDGFIGGPAASTMGNIADLVDGTLVTPGADKAGVFKDFLEKEIPAIRQMEGAWKFFKRAAGNEAEQNMLDYHSARTRIREVNRDIEETGGDVALRYARRVVKGFQSYDLTARTYDIRAAAEAIAKGTPDYIEAASERISDVLVDTDERKLMDARNSLKSALMNRAPLSSVNKRNRAEFRKRFTTEEWKIFTDIDTKYRIGVGKAFGMGVRDANRKIDHRKRLLP